MRGKVCNLLVSTVIFATVPALPGCGAVVRLYPVGGPLAIQTAPPVFSGKIEARRNKNAGSFSAVLADGERFKGSWMIEQATPGVHSRSAKPAPTRADNMDPVWDEVYGQAFYVARVLGAGRFGRATVVGSRGTVLEMEIHSPVAAAAGVEASAGSNTGPNTGSGLGSHAGPHAGPAKSPIEGVARDSRGNVYKVVFG